VARIYPQLILGVGRGVLKPLQLADETDNEYQERCIKFADALFRKRRQERRFIEEKLNNG
jgi:hypothetical protein